MRTIVSVAVCGVMAVGGAARAAPTVGVTPAAIDRFDGSSVEVTASGLSGGELWLRLWVDADANGALGAVDYPVWSDRVPDNGTEWSSAMPVDRDPATGTVTIDARVFGPFGFPRTAGRFLWQAVDPADGSFAVAPLTVVQAPGLLTLSGRVFADGTALAPGALVVLAPLAPGCGESVLTAVADVAGGYSVEIPAVPGCGPWIARASRPGSYAALEDAAILDLPADPLAGVDLHVRAGASASAATVVYASGDRAGEGVPGITLVATTPGGAWAVAFSDENGAFDFGLDAAGWRIHVGDAALPPLQGAVSSFDLAAAPGEGIALPAVNAFVRGRLLDEVATPLAGAAIVGRVAADCAGDCWTATTVSASDGRYVLGLVGPPAPAAAPYAIEPAAPLPGLLAGRILAELSEGAGLIGRNLDHAAPTGTIEGRVANLRGDALAGLCLRADNPGARRTARVRTDCDGRFALPALDGPWDVRVEPGALAALLFGVEGGPRQERVVVGSGGRALDLLLGPPADAPFLRSISPSAGPAGTHVVLEGGNFGVDPLVTFDGVPAEVLAVRTDLGRLVVKTPPGLVPGTAKVAVQGAASGGEQCFEVLPGSFVPACGISGQVTQNAGADRVAGALVVAFDSVTDQVERVDVTDGRGRYDLGLDDPGADYGLLIYSPQGNLRVTGLYPALPCPLTQNHNLRAGRPVSGEVRDAAGAPIPNVRVEARGVLAGGSTVTRADGTYGLRLEEGDNVTIRFDAPPGSRFVNDRTLALSIPAGPVGLPDVVLATGSVVAGRVIDPLGSPRAATIAAERRESATRSGAARTNTCDGTFAIALDGGDHRLRVQGARDGGVADVDWITADGDGIAPFPFIVSSPAALAFTGTEPRLNDETAAAGRVGQAVVLGVENLGADEVEVLFETSSGDTVAGRDTAVDAARGLVFTRVPAGAAPGGLFVRAAGTDTLPVPFAVLDEPWVQGGFVLSGRTILDIDPIEGVLALLFLVDPNGIDCNPMGRLHDFDVSDAMGRFDLRHPGGDVFVLLLPPREGSRLVGPPLTLAATYRLFGHEFGNRVFSAFLVQGVPLALRVVTGSPPEPVSNARVAAQDDAPDFAITGPSGLAKVYMRPEFPGPVHVDVQVLPPVGSRLLLRTLQALAPGNLGDVALEPGVFVSSQVTDDAGAPVAEVTASGFQGVRPAFDTVVRGDGVWRGPVVPEAGFSVALRAERLDLADALIEVGEAPERDRILVPGLRLPAAGILAGRVQDAVTGAVVAGARVTAFADDGGERGLPSAFAASCANGEFRAKAAEGFHRVVAEPRDPATHFAGWYTDGPTGFCPLDAQSVLVETGTTTDGIDMAIDPRSMIGGTVRVFDQPMMGAAVSATLGRLGSCEVGANSGQEGSYDLVVPAGGGYRVRAEAPRMVGGPVQCFDGLVGCVSFTPVGTTPLGMTAGIDFTFRAAPPEVGLTLPLLVDKNGDDLVLTFEELPPEAAAGVYNVYRGTLGAYDAAVEATCFLDPALLASDGAGRLAYGLAPHLASEWFLVSASNPAAESSLGPGRALTNACGPTPSK